MSEPIQGEEAPKDDYGSGRPLLGKPVQRFPRFQSHALVDVRTSRWNPFKTASAVLLDLSVEGFKLEFVSAVTLRVGQRVRLVVPLAPFQILSPSRLELEVEIKWFDVQALRAGGVFKPLSDIELHTIEKLMDRLLSMEKPRA